MPKRTHNYLDDPKPPKSYDEDEGSDYRTSLEARKLLTRIETLVAKKKKVNTRYLNERVAVPKKWSLEDIIAVSKKVEVVKGYVDVYTAKDAKKGLPKPDAFQVGKASERIEAQLGL